MQLNNVEVVRVVADSKSLSQASERLHMSRPALTQRITQIEKEYKTTLFERTSQGITPTKAGLMVAQYAQRINVMNTELTMELASLTEAFQPDIAIGMSLADGVELLPGIVAKFHEVHPEVRIHLDAGYEPKLLQGLLSYKLDFALLEDRSMESGFTWDFLGQEELMFLAPNKPPYNKLRQPVKFKNLLPLPMVIYEWDSGRHMVGNRHFRIHESTSLNDHNVVARMDTHEAMIRAVRAGMGWASFPACIWRRYKDDPGLITIKVDTPPVLYDVNLVAVKGRPLSSLAKEFYQFVKEHIPEGYFVETAIQPADDIRDDLAWALD